MSYTGSFLTSHGCHPYGDAIHTYTHTYITGAWPSREDLEWTISHVESLFLNIKLSPFRRAGHNFLLLLHWSLVGNKGWTDTFGDGFPMQYGGVWDAVPLPGDWERGVLCSAVHHHPCNQDTFLTGPKGGHLHPRQKRHKIEERAPPERL